MKRLLSIILVALFIISMTACEKSENKNAENSGKQTGNIADILNHENIGNESANGDETPDNKDKEKPMDIINKITNKVEEKEEEIVDHGESLAPVNLDGKWGYINTSGEFVIEPQYSQAYSFHYGAAVVELEEEPVLINKKNEVLFNGDISKINDGSDGMFMIEKGRKISPITGHSFINYHIA